MKKAVKFLKPTTIGTLYNVDDIAGFEPEVADGLIKQGLAEAVGKKGTAAKTDETKTGDGAGQ